VLLVCCLLTACPGPGSGPVTQWKHAEEGAYAAYISRDGHYSLVSSIHHGVALWDNNDNALKYIWSQQQSSSDNLVLATYISDNNSHAVTASRENFSLWNITNGASEGYWKVRNSNIRDIAVANDGKSILLGKGNGVAVHLTLSSGRRLEFLGHTEKINSVDIYPNGRIAISGGNDFVAYVWDTESGQVIYKFNHPTRVTKVALDPHGRYAFSGDSMKTARIWDLKTGKMVSELSYTNRQEVFSSVRFSADGKLLATGAPTRKISLWDIATGQRLKQWRVTPRQDIRPAGAVVYSVAFRDNRTLISESSAGYAELWSIPQNTQGN
jgi:WD40 repeat protein